MFDKILFIYMKSCFSEHNVYQSQETVALLTAEGFGEVGRKGLVTTQPDHGRSVIAFILATLCPIPASYGALHTLIIPYKLPLLTHAVCLPSGVGMFSLLCQIPYMKLYS